MFFSRYTAEYAEIKRQVFRARLTSPGTDIVMRLSYSPRPGYNPSMLTVFENRNKNGITVERGSVDTFDFVRITFVRSSTVLR